MISSPKIKACALLLVIVILLIQTDSIEAKGRFGGRAISRSWSRSSIHGSATGGHSSRTGYSGYSSHPVSRSTGSTGTSSSLLLIATGVLTVVFLDAGRRSSYRNSDEI